MFRMFVLSASVDFNELFVSTGTEARDTVLLTCIKQAMATTNTELHVTFKALPSGF